MKTSEKLFLILKTNPLPFILYGIIIFLWNGMIVYSAICLQSLFDVFEESNHISEKIYFHVAVLVGVYIIRGVTSFVVMGLECWGGFFVDSFLKLNVVEKIYAAYGAKFSDKAEGEILNIFRSDIDQIKNFLLQLTEETALGIYFCVIMIVLMKINPLILLVTLVISFSSVFLIRAGFESLAKYRKEVRKTDGIVNSFAGEVLTSTLAVKMAGTENCILDYYEELGRKRERISVRENVLKQVLNSANQVSFQIGEGVILLLAFELMRNGNFSMGDFALFTFLFDSISNIISSTAQLITQIPQVEIAFERLETLVGECEENTENIKLLYQKRRDETEKKEVDIDKVLQRLEVRNLEIYNQNGNRILEKINMVLDKGSITVVVGKTMEGKTMLLRSILGLYPMSSGELYYNGKKILNPSRCLVPPRAAYTPQKPNFFNNSIRNNIMLGRVNSGRKEENDLEGVLWLSALQKDFEDGRLDMDTILGVKGTKISGGQRKRIALARMYARKAELYVLDDVSNALDVETELELWKQVKKQFGKTFLIASNSRYAIEIADQIVLLENGKAQVYKSLEEAISKSSYMRLLVNT
mgnify:CR=1 FL=1